MLKAEDVNKLCALLSQFTGNADISARCSDKTVREFGSAEQFLAYENSPSRTITQISINGGSYTVNRAELNFRSSKYIPQITYRFSGEDSDVQKCAASVLEIIEGVVPWYQFATKSFRVGIFIFFLCQATTYLLLYRLFGINPFDPKSSFTGILWTIIGLNLATWIISNRLDRIFDRYFPVATFAIGQGLARHNHQQMVRWNIVVGFAVNIAADLAMLVVHP